MDDFLHNLRSGKLKQADRAKRPYQGQFKSGQKKVANYPQNQVFESKGSFERLNAIKDVLVTLANTQQRMVEAYEARNRAEERKARAFEVLAMNIYKMVNPQATDIDSMFAPLAVENTVEQAEMQVEAAADEDEFVEFTEDASEPVDVPAEMDAEQSNPETSGGNSHRKLFKLIDTLRSEGTNWTKIADEIAARGYPTISGRGIWRGGMVKALYEKMSAAK